MLKDFLDKDKFLKSEEAKLAGQNSQLASQNMRIEELKRNSKTSKPKLSKSKQSKLGGVLKSMLKICLMVDDYYKKIVTNRLRQGGYAPKLTDSELITMEIVGKFL